jgi:hypothetical protein
MSVQNKVTNFTKCNVHSVKALEKKWKVLTDEQGNNRLKAVNKNTKVVAETTIPIIEIGSCTNMLIKLFQKDHIFALQHQLGSNFQTYLDFARGITENAELSQMLIVMQSAFKGSVTRHLRLEHELAKTLWSSREQEMKLEKELIETKQALLERQIIAVLEQRVKFIASKQDSNWLSYTKMMEVSFASMAEAFRLYKDEIPVRGTKIWKMDKQEADAIKYALEIAFPSLKKQSNDIICNSLQSLGWKASDVRSDAMNYAHQQNLEETQIDALVKGTEFEELFDTLKEVNASCSEFKPLKPLQFLKL